MSNNGLPEALQLFESLKKEFNGKKVDLTACQRLLSQLKIKLTGLGFLEANADPKQALLAREVLEVGALVSVRAHDIDAFERYVQQLGVYYFDFKTTLTPSQRMYLILGLNLLCLLAQNRIAEFHTQLERVDANDLLSNPFIQHPVQLEQCLMEGSYNKVFRARSDVPAEEYGVFMDMLMKTIRSEIASCCEKSFESLLLQDASTLLHLSATELTAFIQERGWQVQPADQRIHFEQEKHKVEGLQVEPLLKHQLYYARELERIV